MFVWLVWYNLNMKNESQYIPPEVIETQLEPKQELSPEIANLILAKVKDVTDEETRRHIGVHNMGGEGDGIDDRNIQGGLFKTEKVLSFGLVSPQFADRVGIRTSFGYGLMQNLVEMGPLTNENYYKKGTMPKAWSVLVDTSNVPKGGSKNIGTRFADRRISPQILCRNHRRS